MPSSRFIFGTLPWYSVLIVAGVCLALLIAGREEKRLGLPTDSVVDLALWVIPAGIIGARAYYVVFAWETFRQNPVSVLYIWQGGLAIYGAVLGGLAAAALFSRVKRLPLRRLTDMIVPGLLLAQAIGRWGNFFNMEAYGLPVTSPAWQFFPAAVLIPGAQGDTWHMATFFYESLWNALGFLVLMGCRKRMSRAGDVTLWYFLLYGSGRMMIEGLRTDSLMATDTLRISQLLSAVLCTAALCVFVIRIVKFTTRRVLYASAATGIAFALFAALLPRPAAFTGYELMLLAAMFLTSAAAVMLLTRRQHVQAIGCMTAAAVNLLARWVLTRTALPAWGVSTLLTAALSLLLLTAAACAYTAAGASSSQRSSTAS